MSDTAKLKAEDHGPPIEDYSGSFWSLLRTSAEHHPDHTALICCEQANDHLQWLSPLETGTQQAHFRWTYTQLLRAAKTLGQSLQKAGIERASRLVVLCPNNAEWAVLLWACASIGVTFVPLNAGLVGRTKEMRHVLETIQPSGIAVFNEKDVVQLEEQYSDVLNTQLKLHLDQNSTSLPTNWVNLIDLVGSAHLQPEDVGSASAHDIHGAPAVDDNAAVILFTSGTTSLPKAVPHTGKSLEAQSRPYWSARRIQAGSKVVPIGPGFHILTVYTAIMTWRAGASVVFAAPQFDPGAVVHALNTQEPTNISCSPSIMMSLLSHPDFSPDGYPSLKVVAMGADRVSKELVEQCKDTFRPEKVANGWGMTEGIGILGSPFEESPAWREGELTVGHVLPGAAVRVCEPETTDVVEREVPGELHISGPQVLAGYYAGSAIVRNDSFYEDEGRLWFKTGDAVVMDDAGNIFLTGRFKDLIIRGGENIHPGLVEGCLNAALPGVQAQVVGIDDAFVGQAIAAILRVGDTSQDNAALKQLAQNSVIAELGTAFRLTVIYTLPELGLDSFPMTATNKVRKAELQNKVRERMQSDQNGSDAGDSSILQTVMDTWQRVLATGPEEIDPNTHVTQIADSLALMQFCSLIQRRLNKRLTPADVLENVTPQLQAALLDAQSQPRRETPDHDLSTIKQSSAHQSWLTPSIRSKLETHISEMGFNWETDVEAVYQGIDAIEMFDAPKCRPVSHNFRWTWRPRRDMSPDHMLSCLKKCLQSHASLRAVVVPLEHDTWYPSAPHVVLGPSTQWLETLIQVVQPVDNVESLQAFTQNSTLPFAEAGGPCLRALIVPVAGSERPGLVMTINHAVFDAVSISTFFDDLEELLAGNTAHPRSLIPYSIFADMYHLHKDGTAGQISKSFQLEKFQHLDGVSDCLWPALKGPGVMIGDDAGWTHKDGTPGKPMERMSRDAATRTNKGLPVARAFDVPGLKSLKDSHAIEPFVLVKAALAIFNVSKTKQHRAVFSSTEAGRKWPFMEPWVASQLASPMDVAGPTLGWAFDFIDVEPSMTGGDLLQQVAEAQKLNTEHCHAPWATIIRDMAPEDGDLVHDIAARQLVSWDPSARRRAHSQQRLLEQLDRQAFLDYALFWNFGLESPSRMTAFALYDDVHLTRSEVEAALHSMQTLIEKLSEAGNWEQPIGKLM